MEPEYGILSPDTLIVNYKARRTWGPNPILRKLRPQSAATGQQLAQRATVSTIGAIISKQKGCCCKGA